MDIETYINEKVKLFRNKNYFQLFKTILINLSKNFSVYKKQYSLAGRMDSSKTKEKISSWFYIMKIVLDKLKTKEKKFFIKNNLNTNPLVFSYLVKLCKNKLAKLEKIANVENTSMDNILRLYLDLCQVETNKETEEISKNQKSFYDETDSNTNTYTKISKKTFDKNKLIEKKDPIEADFKKKYGIGKFRLLYNRSLSRLFIGDTDEKSVQKTHLMNVKVKKDRLKSNGIPLDKSEIYARRIINEYGEEKGNYIDDDLNRIINKFKRNQKYLDDYKKHIKLEQSQRTRKLKTNNSKLKIKNKKIKMFNIKSPKNIFKSSSQVNYTNFYSPKIKTRNFNFNSLYNNKNSKTNTINFSSINNKKNNFFVSKIPKSNKRYIFSGFNGKRKISKIFLDKFRKYNNNENNNNCYTNIIEKKVDVKKNYFINKKDFFFNNEFNV